MQFFPPILYARRFFILWHQLWIFCWVILLFPAASSSNHCGGYQETSSTATLIHQGAQRRRGQENPWLLCRLGRTTLEAACRWSQYAREQCNCYPCYGQAVIWHKHISLSVKTSSNYTNRALSLRSSYTGTEKGMHSGGFTRSIPKPDFASESFVTL